VDGTATLFAAGFFLTAGFLTIVAIGVSLFI